MKFSLAIPFVLGAVLRTAAQVADPAKAAELVADLKKAPTQVARLNILNNNRDVNARSRLISLTSILTARFEPVVVRFQRRSWHHAQCRWKSYRRKCRQLPCVVC